MNEQRKKLSELNSCWVFCMNSNFLIFLTAKKNIRLVTSGRKDEFVIKKEKGNSFMSRTMCSQQ